MSTHQHSNHDPKHNHEPELEHGPLSPADDPLLTAYALGELDADERRAVEVRLERDPAARAHVEELERFGTVLSQELASAVPAPSALSSSQRDAIERALAGDAPRGRLLPGPWALSLGLLAAAATALVGARLLWPTWSLVPMSEQAKFEAPHASGAAPATSLQLDSGRIERHAKRELSENELAGKDRDAVGQGMRSLGYSDGVTATRPSQPAPSETRDFAEARRAGEGGAPIAPPVLAPDASDNFAKSETRAAADDEAGATASTTLPRLTDASEEQQKQMVGWLERIGNDPRALGARSENRKSLAASESNEGVPARELQGLGYSTEAAPTGRRQDEEDGGDAYAHRTGMPAPQSGESYAELPENPFRSVRDEFRTTFSIDVDTASYANVRRFLRGHQLPPRGAVRIEELVNAFHYDYPEPERDADGVLHPIAVAAEVVACPWNAEHKLVRIGLKGRAPSAEGPHGRNLVFLVDVSGSMASADKLPLLKDSLKLLVEALEPADTIGIVTYAGESSIALQPTPVEERQVVLAAIERLRSGGSTNGGAGIHDAYALAQAHLVEGGVNRVVLATDGDFNVGVTREGELEQLITEKRASGVFLSVLGFGTGNLQDAKMELLADKGNGNYAYIDSLAEARKTLVRNLDATLEVVAKDVKLQLEFNPLRVQSYRQIGYENRSLANQDFLDDRKDAGELGAGQGVTALYEVVPVGSDEEGMLPLKYLQPGVPSVPTAAAKTDQLLTVYVNYKQPESSRSALFEVEVRDQDRGFQEASADTRFAAAVAAFGMRLRGSSSVAGLSFGAVREWAEGALGRDADGERHGFLNLVDWALDASRENRTGGR